MVEIVDYNVPLGSYFNVPEKFLPFSTLFLRSAAAKDCSTSSVSRLLNSLNQNEYMTIGDILNASWNELSMARNLGKRGQLLLFELLRRIADQPELIEGVANLIQNEQERLQQKQRIEHIKAQLRDMGLIL